MATDIEKKKIYDDDFQKRKKIYEAYKCKIDEDWDNYWKRKEALSPFPYDSDWKKKVTYHLKDGVPYWDDQSAYYGGHEEDGKQMNNAAYAAFEMLRGRDVYIIDDFYEIAVHYVPEMYNRNCTVLKTFRGFYIDVPVPKSEEDTYKAILGGRIVSKEEYDKYCHSRKLR